jgi:prenyltransferase beta subunit
VHRRTLACDKQKTAILSALASSQTNSFSQLTHFVVFFHFVVFLFVLFATEMLGDDYSRVDRHAILSALASLQTAEGSFQPMATGGEADLRFVYCAAAVSTLLRETPNNNNTTTTGDDNNATAAAAAAANDNTTSTTTTATDDKNATTGDDDNATAAAVAAVVDGALSLHDGSGDAVVAPSLFPFDTDAAVAFIRSSQAYDGGIGLCSGG